MPIYEDYRPQKRVIPLKKSYSMLPKTPYEIHKSRDPEAHGITVGFIAIIVALIIMATLK